MKEFKEIYGGYATDSFIRKIKDISREAKEMAIMSRNDSCNKDIHSARCIASVEAVMYWEELELKADKWLKEIK